MVVLVWTQHWVGVNTRTLVSKTLNLSHTLFLWLTISTSLSYSRPLTISLSLSLSLSLYFSLIQSLYANTDEINSYLDAAHSHWHVLSHTHMHINALTQTLKFFVCLSLSKTHASTLSHRQRRTYSLLLRHLSLSLKCMPNLLYLSRIHVHRF